MDLCMMGLERSKRMDGYFQKKCPQQPKLQAGGKGSEISLPPNSALFGFIFISATLCFVIGCFLGFFPFPKSNPMKV